MQQNDDKICFFDYLFFKNSQSEAERRTQKTFLFLLTPYTLTLCRSLLSASLTVSVISILSHVNNKDTLFTYYFI
jgi:hypothetical protein